MDIVGLKVQGKFARLDPKTTENGARGSMKFDRDSVGPHESIEVTKPDDRFMLRFIEADRIVAFNPSGGIELRLPDERGHWESPNLVELPGGKIVAYVDYGEGTFFAYELVRK